jgi:hypothetical protein
MDLRTSTPDAKQVSNIAKPPYSVDINITAVATHIPDMAIPSPVVI